MPDTSPPETDPRDSKIAEQSRLLAELTKENMQFREENKQIKDQNKQLEKRIKRPEALLATKVVSDTIEIFPPDVDRGQCVHHRFQSAWRIVDRKAVYLRNDAVSS